LPPALAYLDVSGSSFSGGALQSLFDLLTNKFPHPTPLIVRAANIKFDAADLAFLKELSVTTENENVAEFDWSGSAIPKEYAQSFFNFLYTQKRLRLLVLNNTQPSYDAGTFLTSVAKLVGNMQLVGLDLAGRFPKDAFVGMTRLLADATWLNRLVIRVDGGGDDVLSAYGALIRILPALAEVGGDGFSPGTADVFWHFWGIVAQHPSIKACDWPKQDLARLKIRLKVDIVPRQHRIIIGRVWTLNRPSTPERRRDFEGVDAFTEASRSPGSAFTSVLARLEGLGEDDDAKPNDDDALDTFEPEGLPFSETDPGRRRAIAGFVDETLPTESTRSPPKPHLLHPMVAPTQRNVVINIPSIPGPEPPSPDEDESFMSINIPPIPRFEPPAPDKVVTTTVPVIPDDEPPAPDKVVTITVPVIPDDEPLAPDEIVTIAVPVIPDEAPLAPDEIVTINFPVIPDDEPSDPDEIVTITVPVIPGDAPPSLDEVVTINFPVLPDDEPPEPSGEAFITNSLPELPSFNEGPVMMIHIPDMPDIPPPEPDEEDSFISTNLPDIPVFRAPEPFSPISHPKQPALAQPGPTKPAARVSILTTPEFEPPEPKDEPEPFVVIGIRENPTLGEEPVAPTATPVRSVRVTKPPAPIVEVSIPKVPAFEPPEPEDEAPVVTFTFPEVPVFQPPDPEEQSPVIPNSFPHVPVFRPPEEDGPGLLVTFPKIPAFQSPEPDDVPILAITVPRVPSFGPPEHEFIFNEEEEEEVVSQAPPICIIEAPTEGQKPEDLRLSSESDSLPLPVSESDGEESPGDADENQKTPRPPEAEDGKLPREDSDHLAAPLRSDEGAVVEASAPQENEEDELSSDESDSFPPSTSSSDSEPE
jgi:hypothetical protein